MDLVKVKKKTFPSKDIMKIVQLMEWEKIFEKYMQVREFVSRIFK